MLSKVVFQVFDLIEGNIVFLFLIFLLWLCEYLSIDNFVSIVTVRFISSLMSEKERGWLSIQGNESIFVFNVIILNWFIVFLLITNRGYSVWFPLSLEDISNQSNCANDKQAERKQNSEEKKPRRWLKDISLESSHFDKWSISLWWEWSVRWARLSISHDCNNQLLLWLTRIFEYINSWLVECKHEWFDNFSWQQFW